MLVISRLLLVKRDVKDDNLNTKMDSESNL